MRAVKSNSVCNNNNNTEPTRTERLRIGLSLVADLESSRLAKLDGLKRLIEASTVMHTCHRMTEANEKTSQDKHILVNKHYCLRGNIEFD